MSLPTTVGLCPNPHCTAEFYMPDSKPGDLCPMHHGESDDAPPLVVFVPLAEVVEFVAATMNEHLAHAISCRFGGSER